MLQLTACPAISDATLEIKVCYYNSRSFQTNDNNKTIQKIWVDKGTEFKGSFEALCKKKGIKTYST